MFMLALAPPIVYYFGRDKIYSWAEDYFRVGGQLVTTKDLKDFKRERMLENAQIEEKNQKFKQENGKEL